jgi:hypothetical protein
MTTKVAERYLRDLNLTLLQRVMARVTPIKCAYLNDFCVIYSGLVNASHPP